MYYCGLDLHAKSSAFCILTSRGRKVAQGKVSSTRQGFEEMLSRSAGEPVRLVVEASTRTRWAAGVLERLGGDVVVVDPRKMRLIAETKHKTDKLDAWILADLLRTKALPKPLWQVPQATRALRDQVRVRWGLVRERASLTLRARSLLSSVGINLGKRALASPATWDRVLKRRDVPAHMKKLLEILRESIVQLGKSIATVEAEYASRLEAPPVQIMMEIPAVGPVTALTTFASIGDPGRFRGNSRLAAAYTGLVPTERSSGDRRRLGHITKSGPSELRRVWIQAAQAALRMRSHPLKAWAQKLIYRRGRAVAVVALARRLFRWAFAMWREGKHFDPKLATGAAR